MKTPIRYAGGKSKAYNIITEYIPRLPAPNKIISPFIGGGSLESKWSSELDIPVYGFDIFDALVNFWQILLSDSEALADKLSTLNPTKEVYEDVKEKLLSWEYTQDMLKDWKTDYYKRNSIHLDKVTAAAFYYFNHNLSYGPMYLGWMSKIYQNKDKWNKMIESIRNYKNTKLKVEKCDFSDVIEDHANEFLYLDPPYYLDKDSDNKMLKGMYPNCNIDVHHSNFNHELLRDLLHNHKGNFILSYNDCETIRRYYSEFNLYYPKWHYSYQAGEKRVGKNKKQRGVTHSKKESHEILITNF
mgnify:FL=1